MHSTILEEPIDFQNSMFVFKRPRTDNTRSSWSTSQSKKSTFSSSKHSHFDAELPPVERPRLTTQSQVTWPGFPHRKQDTCEDFLSNVVLLRWLGGPRRAELRADSLENALDLAKRRDFASFSDLVFSRFFSASLIALRSFLSSWSSTAKGSLHIDWQCPNRVYLRFLKVYFVLQSETNLSLPLLGPARAD